MKNKHDNFLQEIEVISKTQTVITTFEKLDLSKLNTYPPKKKNHKKPFSTFNFRKHKK